MKEKFYYLQRRCVDGTKKEKGLKNIHPSKK